MALLSVAANKAFTAGVREANTNFNANPARRRFEALAKQYGLSVTWPGLYPECKDKDGRQVVLAVNM